MNTYKVRFSYLQDGRRVYDEDIAWGDSAQEAVDQIRDEYLGFCEDLKIESVWGQHYGSFDDILTDWE